MKKAVVTFNMKLTQFYFISFFIVSFSFSTHCFAQDWSPVGSGLSQAKNLYYPEVLGLTIYDGKLYAGGFFDTAGNQAANNIAAWDGTNWSAVGTGVKDTGLYGAVSCFAVYNGKLYVGGSFDSAGGVPANNIAAWDGANWSALGKGIIDAAPYGYVSCMTVYNGKLYVGGSFDSAGGIHVNNIASWDGTNWSVVGPGIKKGSIDALLGYDSVLYAGGAFDSAGGNLCNSIAQWNGTNWAPLGTGLLFYGSQLGDVHSLCIYKGSLYAGGIIDSAGGIPAIILAAWNGIKWDSVVSGARSSQGWVNSMVVTNGTLFLGGSFNYVNGVHSENVASWNGTNWSPLGNGIEDTTVRSLCVYNNELFAGGAFFYSGATSVNGIAQWNYPLGIASLQKNSSTMNIYPNPGNGVFTVQSSGLSGQVSVEVYNILGEEVYSKYSLINSPSSINLSNQPNGVYLYRLLSENGTLIREGKVIIQK